MDIFGKKKLKKEIAKKIKDCFRNLDFTRERFIVDGEVIKSLDGEYQFIRVREFDFLEARLNVLIDELND